MLAPSNSNEGGQRALLPITLAVAADLMIA
jgi:hypothetical protein